MDNVIKAIIVDDEEGARDVLYSLLQRSCPKIIVQRQCSDLMSAVEAIRELQPDVVFLDVQMPNYAGYEITKFFNEINFEIIFVTAYDHYAIKAFELCAIDYLVKPIHRDRLIQAVERLEQRITEKRQISDYQILQESLKSEKLDKIIIPELGQKRVIAINDLISIQAQGAYCKITTKEDVITVSKNLRYFEDLLSDFDTLFRTHKSWIINLSFISGYSKSDSSVTLSNDQTVKLSRYRKELFENKLAESKVFL